MKQEMNVHEDTGLSLLRAWQEGEVVTRLPGALADCLTLDAGRASLRPGHVCVVGAAGGEKASWMLHVGGD
jgi:hypothetical protein